jgi:hypothetical protein
MSSCVYDITCIARTQKWQTWTEITNLKGVDECNAWLESGRLIWRQCPKTAGVYEYQDTMDFKQSKEVTNLTTVKTEQSKSKAIPDAEDLAELDKLMDWSQDNALIFGDLGKGKGKGPEKGRGGSKSSILAIADMDPKGKGAGSRGKGKGKGKPAQVLAIEDGAGDEDEDEEPAVEEDKKQLELDAAYQKCKAMQLLLTKTRMNVEEQLPSFKKSPYSNKNITDSISTNIKELDDHIKKAKQIVVAKKAGIDFIKKALTDAAGVIKESQQWVSKMKLLSQDDAASVATRSKKSKTM